jgi:diguanylate cyclase (GGDEF)-like protein
MLKSRQAYRNDFDQLLKKETLVVYIDVDDFKNFNDRYGHKIGDVVLESVAHQMIDAFGRQHCYRYGGDEFIIVLPHKDDQAVLAALRAIQEELKDISYGHLSLQISFTAGYCSVSMG